MIQSAAELFRQEGREQGWEQAQEKNATNLLRDGMNLDKIVQLTDLSPDAVQKLQRETDEASGH